MDVRTCRDEFHHIPIIFSSRMEFNRPEIRHKTAKTGDGWALEATKNSIG